MFELESESTKQIEFYRAHISEFGQISDALRYPRFSDSCLSRLAKIIGNIEAPKLIHAVVRMRDYTNESETESTRQEVKELLRINHGIRLPRGKRPSPGMVTLVSQISPILLFYGLPLRTSERSRLVLALRLVTEEIGLKGDPRDELRRIKKRDLRHANDTKRFLYSVFAKSLIPKK